MAKIVESLKRLSVENVTLGHENERNIIKNEPTFPAEEAVSLENYVLAICGTQSDPEFRVGVALSNYQCTVYSVGETFDRTITLTHNQAPIVGIKFSPTSRNILYTATSDGCITVCDLRAKGKVINEFKDNTEGGKVKPLASFDISCDERLLAGGTEHIGADTFILFWDLRYSNSKANNKNNLLGGYWESHVGDVTCLAFHSTKQDILASGSTDGLINVFDLTKSTEDSALTYSLNTESSVDKLGWLNDENLWCTTHTHTVQFWNCEGATPYVNFDRRSVAVSQNEDPDNYYLVKVHTKNAQGYPFILTGSSSFKGESLRYTSIVENQLEACHNLSGNKQIVRDSWLHEKSGCLITGGESGIVNAWEQADLISAQPNSGNKLLARINGGKRRDKQHRTKPY